MQWTYARFNHLSIPYNNNWTRLIISHIQYVNLKAQGWDIENTVILQKRPKTLGERMTFVPIYSSFWVTPITNAIVEHFITIFISLAAFCETMHMMSIILLSLHVSLFMGSTQAMYYRVSTRSCILSYSFLNTTSFFGKRTSSSYVMSQYTKSYT